MEVEIYLMPRPRHSANAHDVRILVRAGALAALMGGGACGSDAPPARLPPPLTAPIAAPVTAPATTAPTAGPVPACAQLIATTEAYRDCDDLDHARGVDAYLERLRVDLAALDAPGVSADDRALAAQACVRTEASMRAAVERCRAMPAVDETRTRP